MNSLDNNDTNELKRNGFISFWLWLCFIVSGLAAIGYLLLMFSSKGLWSATPEPVWLRLVWLFSSIVLLIGYWMLLKWKQNGFIIIMLIQLITIVLNLFLSGDVGINITFFSPIVGLILLYKILKIKKNGLSYWDAMELKSTTMDIKNVDDRQPCVYGPPPINTKIKRFFN